MKAHLASLGSLVGSKVGTELLIEEFQRPYAWGEVQIEALFKDQFEPLVSGQGKLDNPFLGAIVLLPQSKGRTSVVDGQQRLLTLGLIVGYCSKVLVANRTAVPGYARQFLADFRDSNWIQTEQHVNRDSLQAAMSSNLSLKSTYAEFSTSLSRLAGNDEKVISKRSLVEQDLVPRAFGLIRSQIEDFVDSFESSVGSTGKGNSKAILCLLDHLINNLQMVVVELVSHEQSLAVFEALNAAGQPLSLDQLVKCLVLKLFEKHDATTAKYVHDAWSSGIARGNISFTRKLKTPRAREQFLIIYCNAFIDAASKRSAYRVLKRHFEELAKRKDPVAECRRLIDDMQDYWCFLADCDFELFRFGGEVMIPTIFASRKALVKLGYSGPRLDYALNEIVFLLESGLARAHFLKTPKSLLSSAAYRVNPRLIRARDIGEIRSLISEFFHRLRVGGLGSDELVSKAIAGHTFKGSSKVALLMLRRINVGLRTRYSSKAQADLPTGAKYNLQVAKAYNKNISDKELVSLGYKTRGGADRVIYQQLSQSIGNYLFLIQGQMTGKIPVNEPWTVSAKIDRKYLDARRSWIARRAVMVWKI
jgi:hypothetical protein